MVTIASLLAIIITKKMQGLCLTELINGTNWYLIKRIFSFGFLFFFHLLPVIDVGSFFGVSASGIFIPADSVLRSRGTVTSASRCGLLCPPLVCRAFMYSEDENICNLAISSSTSSEGQIYSKLMRCSRVGGKLICT